MRMPDCQPVVLAGGSSSRMGRPKATLTFAKGETFLERTVELLSSLASPVLVIGGEAEWLARLGVKARFIPDIRPGVGPLGGIETALHSGLADNYIFVGCDQPRLELDCLTELIAADDDEARCWISDGETLSLPLWMKGELAEKVTNYLDGGGRSIKGFITMCRTGRRILPDGWAQFLANVNTAEDYIHLNNFLFYENG